MNSSVRAAGGEVAVELWHRMGMQVRLALYPDDPRLVARYRCCGEALIALHGHAPWRVHDRMLSLLLDTAYDPLLPVAWRLLCLDACTRPMSALGTLVCDDASAARLRVLARRLAAYSCDPADPGRAP